jgi:threonine dehydrogenase-like Zn-dependent dehydrogenase
VKNTHACAPTPERDTSNATGTWSARGVPARTRVVVVDACMESDTIEPLFGISKELDILFARAYAPMEFAQCLDVIAAGEIDVAPMVTGEVGLDGVSAAFEALSDSDAHCKIIVNPAGHPC